MAAHQIREKKNLINNTTNKDLRNGIYGLQNFNYG